MTIISGPVVRVDVHLDGTEERDARGAEVLPGLAASPKWLSPKWACDDGGGVTEAFNRHLLSGLDRELRSYFDSRNAAHVAYWDCVLSGSICDGASSEPHRYMSPAWAARLEFAAGQHLSTTEISARFPRECLGCGAGHAGLRMTSWCTDDAGGSRFRCRSRCERSREIERGECTW